MGRSLGRIRYFVLFLCAAASARATDREFQPLFNGKDLTGWEQVGGRPGVWAVEDGLLVTRSGGGGWLSTRQQYDNFVLRLEYRMQPGGNSGVFMRAPREGNPWIAGMEIQLLDDRHPTYKSLKPSQYTGSIYGVVPPARHATKPAGEWNRIEITARGRHITVVVNGDKVVDANLADYPEAEKEHPGIKRDRGYIGLQSHDERVEFRDLEIRPLD
jgi:hypothetical protein